MPDGDPASPHPETPGDASTSGARTTTSRTTAARPPRDPFLDNARGILITLVVVGHTIESFFQSSEMLPDTIYTWIYSFHMAGFVMISGFLSRSYRNEPRQVRRLLTSMVVPYVIFQLIHEFAKMVLLGDQYHLQLFLPAWTLWFLLALMLWRLATPVLRQLRHPLVFAVAIAVISPLDPGLDSTLTVGRLVSMLPFFVVGLVCTPQMLERLKAFRHRWLGALVLLGALVCTVLMREDFSTSIFFLREAYDEDNGLLIGMVLRLAVLAVGVIGALALLIVTPRGRSPLTTLGERSLTVYLLHPLRPGLVPVRRRGAGHHLDLVGNPRPGRRSAAPHGDPGLGDRRPADALGDGSTHRAPAGEARGEAGGEAGRLVAPDDCQVLTRGALCRGPFQTLDQTLCDRSRPRLAWAGPIPLRPHRGASSCPSRPRRHGAPSSLPPRSEAGR